MESKDRPGTVIRKGEQEETGHGPEEAPARQRLRAFRCAINALQEFP